MSIFDNEIIAKVDELLHSQGEYLPLELLLAEGRLLYNDYDQWRAGNIDRLDSALFGSSDNLIEQLRSAADYLRALNLQPHTLAYRHWGGGNPLQFSDNSLLNDLFQTAYRKSELEPQFDLFMDNTGNNLANEVITALGDRNYAQAQALSEQLINADPLHTKIDPLLTLIEAAMDQEYTADSSFPQQLHDKIAPLAHEHLADLPTTTSPPCGTVEQRCWPKPPSTHALPTAIAVYFTENVESGRRSSNQWKRPLSGATNRRYFDATPSPQASAIRLTTPYSIYFESAGHSAIR